LALIKGAADLLLEGKPGPLTEQQTTFLQTISQNGEHLISLAEDILIQARIDAGIFHYTWSRLISFPWSDAMSIICVLLNRAGHKNFR
jgi:signal transduction histidine kinase